ncbi:CBO0543 family protein [Paenibacillus pinistramenti]|uniref:CBO0543 family protein n=1 Tax=Paenibacillus pinistramenti TaxID=1768003 RepID=UPI003B83596A
MKPIQDPEKLKKVGEFYDRVTQTHYDYFDYWLHNTLFHWDFWISLILTILPWAVWLKFRKEESSDRLLFVAFFVIILSSWLDFIGTDYGLWYYTGKIIPTIPVYIPWDMCLLPVFILFLIQYKPEVSPIIKGLIFAGVSTFIGEPIFLWLGFYVLKKWSIFYSFPIYFLIYLASHKLSKRTKFSKL